MKNILLLSILTTSIFSSMIGEPHDLTAGAATNENELCVFCHPSLYNSDLNTSSFLYNQDANVTDIFINSTATCLSCHDGVSAISDSFYVPILSDNQIDLDKSHPVFVFYNETISSLKNKNTIITGWDSATVINDLLVNGEVKCTSCHNPHNNHWGMYLRRTNKNSYLCISCHTMTSQQ